MNLRHVLASGLLGFVLGAFVVASFQNVAGHREVPAAPTRDSAVDEPAAAIPSPATETATTGHVSAPAAPGAAPASPVAPSGAPAGPAAEVERELVARDLTIPVQGVTAEKLVRSFTDARTGHEHDAIDILAPRNTPVLAVEDGTIAKLFLSKLGGNTIYQFDPSQRFCYYYAHLQRYADGLKEGDAVHRGQVIGYVGTSGNAPPDTPHLHFAISVLNGDHHWWEGTPVDPYDALVR
ncbi:MAG TPA: M23 family metallopeptidase [Vicinamibacterales bacterium]|jgi:murein DD-endopeptidase MepM/ murein hydrolase activator NlpD|nr:M23 family metallopeptidase [Vicinamibacterales bacterium]